MTVWGPDRANRMLRSEVSRLLFASVLSALIGCLVGMLTKSVWTTEESLGVRELVKANSQSVQRALDDVAAAVTQVEQTTPQAVQRSTVALEQIPLKIREELHQVIRPLERLSAIVRAAHPEATAIAGLQHWVGELEERMKALEKK